MIYSLFSNPAFINILILALLIFLILFLWRKIMILEGNLFILDKRVNLLKKDNRVASIPGNIQKANESMNEIFGGVEQPCATSCCFVAQVQEPEMPSIPSDEVQISFTDSITIEDPKVSSDVLHEPDNIISMIEGNNIDNELAETMSVASEITFNTDNKYSQKKLSKLNIDKLKEICTSLNINTEGNTKAQLIAKILENK